MKEIFLTAGDTGDRLNLIEGLLAMAGFWPLIRQKERMTEAFRHPRIP